MGGSAVARPGRGLGGLQRDSGVVGPLGFIVCWLIAFFIIYAILCWQLYGVLAMKDRLATVAIWVGAALAP